MIDLTVIAFQEFGEGYRDGKPHSFQGYFILDGDLSHLDGQIINVCEDTDELYERLYNQADGTFLNEHLTFAEMMATVLQQTQVNLHFIDCGFAP